MKQPLKEAVDAYQRANRARFHMPGHKGKKWIEDITEVAGCDSLFEASGPILQLENEIARVYGAGATLLSAGGATLCIQAMLASLGMGAKIIAGRGLHRSALNAMILLGQEPIWVYPEEAGWFRGPYTPEKIEQAILHNSDAAGIYITSPDYFGCESDIAAIAAVCQRHGKPLLIDNAHGAHLLFFGRHPMQLGASMCADSLHKTLPAMTGGAVLHLKDANDAEEIRRLMALFGSTSPSYPIMLSCESAVLWAEEYGESAFAKTAEHFLQLQKIAEEQGFLLPEATDPAKLTIAYGHRGLTDKAFGEQLRQFGVEPEYIGGGVCVFMGNAFNTDVEYECLQNALRRFVLPKGSVEPPHIPPQPERVMGLREAAFSTSAEEDVENTVGKIAARESSPCPPGIPVVMSGERIDASMADYLRAHHFSKIQVVSI